MNPKTNIELLAYRYFLMLNHMSNGIIGMKYQNFAKLIVDEANGRYMNSQMTSYFYSLDSNFSELLANDPEWIFEVIELEELAEISTDKLEEDYTKYCLNSPLSLEWKKED